MVFFLPLPVSVLWGPIMISSRGFERSPQRIWGSLQCISGVSATFSRSFANFFQVGPATCFGSLCNAFPSVSQRVSHNELPEVSASSLREIVTKSSRVLAVRF